MNKAETEAVSKLLNVLGAIGQMACFREVMEEPNPRGDDCRCYSCRAERAIAEFTCTAPIELVRATLPLDIAASLENAKLMLSRQTHGV